MVKVRKGPRPTPLPTLETGFHEVGCLRAHLVTSAAFLSELKEENGECTVYVYLKWPFIFLFLLLLKEHALRARDWFSVITSATTPLTRIN